MAGKVHLEETFTSDWKDRLLQGFLSHLYCQRAA